MGDRAVNKMPDLLTEGKMAYNSPGQSIDCKPDSTTSDVQTRPITDSAHNTPATKRKEAPPVPAARHLIQQPQPIKVGELVILGYNGSLPHGEKGRRRSKLVVCRRPQPNGVKRSKHYVVKAPQTSQAILDAQQHSISYTLSRNQAIIVEYMPDEDTDMFQVGRSSESPIDFVVMDTVIGDSKLTQSTISRFACRVLCDRNDTTDVRIFAAGFDSSRNIFLGEKATKWQNDHEIDGLTTNGILIMHPARQVFCKDEMGAWPAPSNKAPVWREVSVGGGIYGLRETRSAPLKGHHYAEESSRLTDGTLIDLCGATLLWRSAEGLARSPTRRHLELNVDKLNAGRPQCPVGLNTLVIPRKQSLLSPTDKQPYVYLNCGHVQGLHDWGAIKDSNSRTCPICMTMGPMVKLFIGMEQAFYVDWEPPTYCFNPCGHMASEATVKYWSSVSIPLGTSGFQSMCPFCATPLGATGFVKLIFQDHLD